MAARPRRTKPLQLACWNDDGVRCRKLELDHFLVQNAVDICLLTETHLRSGEAFRMANYICDRTDRLTEGGATVILVRRGRDHYASLDVRSVFPNSHIHLSSLAPGIVQGGTISPVLFSLHVNDMPSPSRHVELALCKDD